MPKPLKPKKDTHSYKGWLNSDSFWKRAFAIYGYAFVAGFVVSIPLYIIIVFGVVLLESDDALEDALDTEVGQIEEYYEE